MKLSRVKSAKKGWILVFWLYMAVLLVISISAYLKILPVKLASIPYYDTIGHFVLLGFAAFLGHLALNKRKIRVLNILMPLAPLLVGFCCIIDEIVQMFSPVRSPSVSDLAADFVGIAVFYWLAEQMKFKQSSNKEKI